LADSENLAGKKFVDLTHEFAPGIPHWPGFPDETRKIIYWYEKRPDTMGVGFFSETFTHGGVHEEAAKNPDYTLTLERLKKWEADHGRVPSGAFVAMRTD
jgi:kynurenine formamidase